MKLSKEIFQQRRQQLAAKIGAAAVLIIPNYSEAPRNGDSHYPFRPSSDFYYLSGCAEPDSILVVCPGRSEGESILFVAPKDPVAELWTGKRLGVAGAIEELGMDQAFVFAEIDQELPKLLTGREIIYYPHGWSTAFDARVVGWMQSLRAQIRAGVTAPTTISGVEDCLHELRLFKSTEEINLMRKAAEISAGAHKHALSVCKPGMFEYELEAEYMHWFIRHGCRFPAYGPIVGGGANACVLHYTDNNAKLQDGDLILVDAGGELEYYAADITRTFPVNGKFSTPQKQIYELVLESQLAAIAEAKPGRPWDAMQDRILEVLTAGLVEYGLLTGKVEDLIANQAYKQFYMHRSGHWLGLDVHDVGRYKTANNWRALEAGMVLTVEPGLYIRPDDTTVAPQWRGIGVRIEDDILITPEGCEIFSKAAPKTVAEIEQIMAQ